MKRFLKRALVACAAAGFAVALAAPVQAQQDEGMAAPTTASQAARRDAAQPGYAARYGTAAGGAYAQSAGEEAYDYVPAEPGYGGGGCATQGSYGQGLDYSACGGGD